MRALIIGAFAAVCLSVLPAQAQNGNGNTGIGNGNGNGNGNNNGANVNFRERYNAPGIGAPGLAAGGADACLGSVSFGASGPGFGLTFGTTTPERDCNIRQYSRLLAGLGHRRAATQMLCFNPDVSAALGSTGVACRVGPAARRAAASGYAAPVRYAGQRATARRQQRVAVRCARYDLFRGCLD